VNSPNIVILAGGVSSRMTKSSGGAGVPPETSHVPKSLIGLGEENRPFLDYLLWNAEQAGYQEVVLVVGERSGAFRERYGTADRGNRFHALEISYAVQKIPEGRTKPLGTADALLQALRSRPDWSGRGCTVCNSDNLYSVTALRMMLDAGDRCALMEYDRDALGFAPARARGFGVLAKDGLGRLVEIIEKPSEEQIMRVTGPDGRVWVSMNLWRFACDIILPFLEHTPMDPVRMEKELPVAVSRMIRAVPGSVVAIPIAEPVPDLTSVGDINAVEEFLRNRYRGKLWQ
jgi:glucose-1-phosphate adenylyltransferase